MSASTAASVRVTAPLVMTVSSKASTRSAERDLWRVDGDSPLDGAPSEAMRSGLRWTDFIE